MLELGGLFATDVLSNPSFSVMTSVAPDVLREYAKEKVSSAWLA